jgi:hypothetical protein
VDTCVGGPSPSLWEDFTIDRLPEDEPEREGRKLKVAWCAIHGQEFCNAIMSGKTKRPVDKVRKESELAAMKNAIRVKAQRTREPAQPSQGSVASRKLVDFDHRHPLLYAIAASRSLGVSPPPSSSMCAMDPALK